MFPNFYTHSHLPHLTMIHSCYTRKIEFPILPFKNMYFLLNILEIYSVSDLKCIYKYKIHSKIY